MSSRPIRPLVLIGAGGHALSLLACLSTDSDVAGYVDNGDSDMLPLPRLANDKDFLAEVSPDEYDVLIAVVSGRDCSLAQRRSIIFRYAAFSSPVVVASTAWIAPDVYLGDGTVAFHRAVVNVATHIDTHCVINTASIIEHNCQIGSNVFVGPGAVICGNVELGDDVYIGAGAAVRPGVRICSGVTVGLGSAVVADISEPGVYAGIPARRLK